MTLSGAPPSKARPWRHDRSVQGWPSGRGVRDSAGPQAQGQGASETLLTRTTAAQVCPLRNDWLLGLADSKARGQGHQVEDRGVPTQELKLELSQSKTLITHATGQAARLFG